MPTALNPNSASGDKDEEDYRVVAIITLYSLAPAFTVVLCGMCGSLDCSCVGCTVFPISNWVVLVTVAVMLLCYGLGVGVIRAC